MSDMSSHLCTILSDKLKCMKVYEINGMVDINTGGLDDRYPKMKVYLEICTLFVQ